VTTAVDGTARGGDLGRRCATAVRAQQPAFGAFWHAYHQGSHGSVHPVRAVAMAGARLLQTCVEGAVAGPAPSHEPLLQASARLLTEPDAAAREVFGL
jgi:hypothetical protein